MCLRESARTSETTIDLDMRTETLQKIAGECSKEAVLIYTTVDYCASARKFN